MIESPDIRKTLMFHKLFRVIELPLYNVGDKVKMLRFGDNSFDSDIFTIVRAENGCMNSLGSCIYYTLSFNDEVIPGIYSQSILQPVNKK